MVSAPSSYIVCMAHANLPRLGNKDVNWDLFDTNQYYANYPEGLVHPDDITMVRQVLGALDDYVQQGVLQPGQYVEAIDVANAGVPVSAAMMQPFMSKEKGARNVWGDIGKPQLQAASYTAGNLARGELGRWEANQQLFNERPLWRDAFMNAGKIAVPTEQDGLALLPNSVEAGSAAYFFESVTQRPHETREGAQRFIQAVMPGGLVIVFATLQSEGWHAGADWPAVSIGPESLFAFGDGELDYRRLVVVEQSASTRAEGDTHRYLGYGALVGIRRDPFKRKIIV